MLIIFDDI